MIFGFPIVDLVGIKSGPLGSKVYLGRIGSGRWSSPVGSTEVGLGRVESGRVRSGRWSSSVRSTEVEGRLFFGSRSVKF